VIVAPISVGNTQFSWLVPASSEDVVGADAALPVGGWQIWVG
jgi:hypothetical protein